jgi:serine/threonine-protein kinase RsbW
MADFAAEVMAEPHAISALSESVAAFLAGSGVDDRAVHHVALVLEELLTNLASYGSMGKAQASVRLTVGADRVDAQLWDCGMEYDPRRTPDVDVSKGIEDRAIGGLGLLLVHRVTDGFDYERVGGRNHTTFWIRRTPAG